MTSWTVDILRILRAADGPVSGTALCARLGISRTAVWKHITALREHGFEISSAPRRGYTLVSAPDVPFAAEIQSARSGCRLGSSVIYLSETDSTNRVGIERAEAGAVDGTVVLAEHQTSGRGRLQRRWHSAPGQGVAMSVILRPRVEPLRVPQLSLVAAVACARTIESTCAGDRVQIKWPNDLYVASRKVAGILCEMRAEMDRLEFLVLGIGVNVNLEHDQFPPELAGSATSLSEATGRRIRRVPFLHALLDELESAYESWLTDGLAPFLDAWRERSLFRGRRVAVDTGAPRPLEGTVRDLREDGALLLETDSGDLRALLSGDVSLHNARPGQTA